MALPLLPASATSEQFERLCRRAISEPMRALFDYIDSTWMADTTWPPSSWSAFRRHYEQTMTSRDGIIA